MSEQASGFRAWASSKPFAIWVIFAGLLYVALALLAVLVPPPAAGVVPITDPLILSVVLFAAIFLIISIFSLTGRRVVFAAAAVVSALFLLLFSGFVIEAFSRPANPMFWLIVSGVPALLLVLVFSVLALVYSKKGVASKRYLASAQSVGGLFALGVVGFVIGGFVVGSLAGGRDYAPPKGRRPSGGRQHRQNAPTAAVPFSPASFTVRVGQTVTLYNGDTIDHTVTSDTGVFDSGPLAPGARWTHTFTTAGTFPYLCMPHPQMKGTIVVNP